MCVILAGWDAHPDFTLVVASNRDEFFERTSLPMHWWEDVPVLAGRDQTAGGSWMTLSASGRFAGADSNADGRLTPPEFATTAPKPGPKPRCSC